MLGNIWAKKVLVLVPSFLYSECSQDSLFHCQVAFIICMPEACSFCLFLNLEIHRPRIKKKWSGGIAAQTGSQTYNGSRLVPSPHHHITSMSVAEVEEGRDIMEREGGEESVSNEIRFRDRKAVWYCGLLLIMSRCVCVCVCV